MVDPKLNCYPMLLFTWWASIMPIKKSFSKFISAGDDCPKLRHFSKFPPTRFSSSLLHFIFYKQTSRSALSVGWPLQIDALVAVIVGMVRFVCSKTGRGVFV